MKIQVHTDNHIHGREALIAHVEAIVEDAMRPFAGHLTRVEVHLGDENGDKPGTDDKRCMIEARLEGHQPLAVTEHAGTLDQAIDGAAEKLKKSLDHTLGRLRAR